MKKKNYSKNRKLFYKHITTDSSKFHGINIPRLIFNHHEVIAWIRLYKSG